MHGLVDHFARFADLFPEPILLLSMAGRVHAANTPARHLLFPGLSRAPECEVFTLLNESPREILDYLRACARSAQPLPALLTLKRLQDRPTAYRCLGSTFKARDDDQQPLVMWRLMPKEASTSRFVLLNQQIEQLRSENARRLRAERLAHDHRRILEITLSSIGDAVIATDVEGRITFMNAVAEAHTGYTSAEAYQRPLEQIFVIRNELTGEPVESPVQKVLRTGTVVGLANHTVLVRSDGAELPIDDSAAPIRDDSGQLFGVILVFHETSESRRLHRQLLQQTEALKEADRRKDQFLAVLAHELRNPMGPLRNGLHLARMKARPDEVQTFDMMERQLLHLIRLVNDLMDVSRVSRGVIELRRTPVLIGEVLARSVESVRNDIELRRHRLSLDLPARPITVDGDADRLIQVFANLLTNSSKYSPDGGSIHLRVTTDETHVVVQVIDTGIGIPTDQLERVFDMFSQVRSHQNRAEGGLGIGLSLVRTLIQMHGGSVTADSDGPGTGSTFTLRLPLLAKPAPCPTPHPRLAPEGRALRIVVADDSDDSARSLQALLEALGHQVRTASDGLEALAVVETFRPQIVFMDVGMPHLDGVGATQCIRQRPGGDTMVIVALTGWGQPGDRERTRVAGVDRHVVKPIGPADIDEVLDMARHKSAPP